MAPPVRPGRTVSSPPAPHLLNGVEDLLADLLHGALHHRANRRHFRGKTLKRLQLEGVLTQGLELRDGGATALVFLTQEMIRKVQAALELSRQVALAKNSWLGWWSTARSTRSR